MVMLRDVNLDTAFSRPAPGRDLPRAHQPPPARTPRPRHPRSSRSTSNVTNERIAELLETVADRLEEQHANRFRIDAYRAGARVVLMHPESIRELVLTRGREGLEELPRIGKSLAARIEEIAHTGRLPMLERLEGGGSPEDVLTRVPGIGARLAHLVHQELHVETLPALLAAAEDGRLETLPGFGPRRTSAVRSILKTMLATETPKRRAASRPTATGPASGWPGVELLLEIDRRYRERATAGLLPQIAPTRNNPEHRAWLPILHADEGGWHFTALFSNTDRAHELGKTDDWVVLYYERNGHENQSTVVTEVAGRLAGRRIVRGQEGACDALYREAEQDPPGRRAG